MIVGLCRFSYLAVQGWKSVPKQLDKARDFLFDETRLDFRFKLFEKYTLPSIALQTDGDFRFIILTSIDLPRDYLDRLMDITRGDNRITVCTLPPMNKGRLIKQLYLKEIGNDHDLISFRIDDDDGLCVNFIGRIKEELRSRTMDKPFCMSYGKGILVKYNGEEISWASECSYPFFSAGLALYHSKDNQKCVYDFGHHKCYQEYDTVVFSGKPGYIRSLHGFNDSRSLERGTEGFDRGTISDIAERFRNEFPYLAVT